MGPLQLTRDRLDELERTEASMNVDDLAVALGKATLDCLNPFPATRFPKVFSLRGELFLKDPLKNVRTVEIDGVGEKITRQSAT